MRRQALSLTDRGDIGDEKCRRRKKAHEDAPWAGDRFGNSIRQIGEVVVDLLAGFEFLGNGFLLLLPFSAVLAGALYLISHFALRRTAAGLFVEAVGDNPIASRFAGIATARVSLLGSGHNDITWRQKSKDVVITLPLIEDGELAFAGPRVLRIDGALLP